MAADARTQLAPWGSSVPMDPLISREHDPFSSQINFREYWRMICKHRLAMISLALAAAFMVVCWRFVRTPQYEATSTILIQPQAPEVMPNTQNFNDEQFRSSTDYDYYRTQFELLKSASLAASVIRSNRLDENPLFNPALRHPGLIASAFAYFTDALTNLKEEIRNLAGFKNNDSAAVEPNSVDPRIINAYLARLTVLPVRNTRLVVIGFTTRIGSYLRVLSTLTSERLYFKASNCRLKPDATLRNFSIKNLPSSRAMLKSRKPR